ncbi:glycoside hydrolase superfamily [Mycena vulgaris]|nr:glycoside hydrolase superfamily [Mycena vulgaris]
MSGQLTSSSHPSAGSWDEAYSLANAMIAKLTPDEKIGLVTGIGRFNSRCVGNVLWIPGLGLNDGPAGVRPNKGVTGFPPGIAAAVTFNRRLMRARGVVLAEEFRGKGINRVLLGPALDLVHAQSQGRTWVGEFRPRSYLNGKAAFETVTGIQSVGVMACAKHFIANNQEHWHIERISKPNVSSGSSSKHWRRSSSRSPTPAPAVVETEESPEAQNGWLEVGCKNRAVARTINETESPISRIFGGKLRSTLRAAEQKDSAIIEACRALRLDIQVRFLPSFAAAHREASQRDEIHTIQDPLSFIAHPQVMQMGAADASLQIHIAALLSVLVLHLKRFYYTGVLKFTKRVAFGPELEIGGGESFPSPARTFPSSPLHVLAPTGRKPVRYKLFAAVYRHGVSAAGGRYPLDVLHGARRWVRIDDELVSDVRAENAFGVEREREEGRCAYLLCYTRVQ